MESNTAKQKAQFSYNRKQVQFLCNINNQQLTDFQIETAHSWLENTLSSADTVEQLMKCKTFIDWWLFMWHCIDDRAILRDIYKVKPWSRYSWYRQMHQYVFDGASIHGKRLLKDFMDMRSQFTATMIKTDVGCSE